MTDEKRNAIIEKIAFETELERDTREARIIECAQKNGGPRNALERNKEKGMPESARDYRRAVLGYLRQIDRIEHRQNLLEYYLDHPRRGRREAWQNRLKSAAEVEPPPMWGPRLAMKTMLAEYVHNGKQLSLLEMQLRAVKARQKIGPEMVQSTKDTMKEMTEIEQIIQKYMEQVKKGGFKNGVFASTLKALRQQS